MFTGIDSLAKRFWGQVMLWLSICAGELTAGGMSRQGGQRKSAATAAATRSSNSTPLHLNKKTWLQNVRFHGNRHLSNRRDELQVSLSCLNQFPYFSFSPRVCFAVELWPNNGA
ncbi:hypothetical protein AOLI_G00158050 [Acnodon oligacanthus]